MPKRRPGPEGQADDGKSDDDMAEFVDGEELRKEHEGVKINITNEKLNFPYAPFEMDLTMLNDEGVWSDLKPEKQTADNTLFQISQELLEVRVTCLFNTLTTLNEYSTRGSYLSRLMIKLNPANYTAWNYRLECLKRLNLDLQEELEFTRRITFESIKSYQCWNHRRQICALAESAFNEIEFVKMEIGTSPKNQCAWGHLTWLINTFGPSNVFEELEFVAFLVSADSYNNSAWNYKSFLIRNFEFEAAFLVGELARDFQLLAERPDNEGLCSYLAHMAQFVAHRFPGCLNALSSAYLDPIKAECPGVACLKNAYTCNGPVTNCLAKSIKLQKPSVQLLRLLKALDRNEQVSRELSIMDPIRFDFYRSSMFLRNWSNKTRKKT